MPVYKVKDGYLIQVSYKDPSGNYRKLSVRRKTIRKFEAQEIEYELRMQAERLRHGETLDPEIVTIKSAVDEFLKYSETQTRKTTMRHKKQVLNLYLVDYFGPERSLSYLLHISNWMTWRTFVDSYVSKKTHKKLSVCAKNSILKDVSVFMNYLYKYKEFDIRAFKKLDRFKNPNSLTEGRSIHYWTLDEFHKVDKVLEANARTLKQQIVRALINTLFFTGMRKGEAYALHWTDLYKSGNHYFFNVNKSLCQKLHGDDGNYFIGRTKNRSSCRKIMLTDRIVSMILKLKELNQNEYFTEKDYYIFGGLQPISDTLLAETMNSSADLAEVHRIKVHDLRHSFVTMLINQNVNIKTISALVGHANTKMTWDVYGHLYPEKENNAIDILNKVFKD